LELEVIIHYYFTFSKYCIDVEGGDVQNFGWKASRMKTILRPHCSARKYFNSIRTSLNSTLFHCAAS
jgi:hypothetical protein